MRRRLKCVESGAHGRLNMARRHGRVVILHVRQRIIWLGIICLLVSLAYCKEQNTRRRNAFVSVGFDLTT